MLKSLSLSLFLSLDSLQAAPEGRRIEHAVSSRITLPQTSMAPSSETLPSPPRLFLWRRMKLCVLSSQASQQVSTCADVIKRVHKVPSSTGRLPWTSSKQEPCSMSLSNKSQDSNSSKETDLFFYSVNGFKS